MRRNIFITYMIVVLISLSITGFLTVRAVEKYFVSNIEDALITDARVIQRFLAAELEKSNNDLSGIDKTVKELSADIGARITVVDLNGDVIADTQKITREMENHSQRPEIKQAYLGQIGKSIRYSSSIKAKMMYVAIPILSNNTIISVLRLSLPLSEIMHLSKFIWGIILSSTLIGLLIAFFASTIFTISVTRPIQDVACASREIARGNYDMKIYTQASGEIKILADSFNYMAKNLKQTINELRDGKNKTEAILGSMAESLIAVDQQCRVIMTNSAAEQLFNVKKDAALNKHLLEIVRNRELYDFINDVLMTKRSVNKELKIFTPEEKVFRINISPINEDENSGAVAVLRDITDLRKLEKVRTEFVANVSHELKTPLTSISGFVETLLDGVYKDQDNCRNFLGIIKQETDRMTRLINELLYFSRIESSVNPIKKTKVDITDVLMKALSVLQTAINDKRQKVSLNLPDEISPLMSNEDSLVQIIINLLDNAVKYTQNYGEISLKARETDKYLAVTITDNGPGIAEEDLPRIFERFYRVDRARSGEMGGTGLGLAVVKHLVKSLDGEITVESELGKGSSFTVKIPRE